MKLAFVILNYNSADYTVRLLESLAFQGDRYFFVYVVDNASQPEDRALLEQYLQGTPLTVRFIANAENLGFSGGNNAGIREALQNESDWIVCLNSDTWVNRNFVQDLKKAFPPHPVLVGIPLKEHDEVAYAGRVQWFRTTLSHVTSPEQKDSILYVIGAALAVHRDVLKKVGLWDDRYFLYFEDAEFSMRVRRHGFPILFLEQPIVLHAGSATTKKLGSGLLLHYHVRNALLFHATHAPWFVRLALPFWSFFIMFKQFLKILLIPHRRSVSRQILYGILDFYQRRFGKLQ